MLSREEFWRRRLEWPDGDDTRIFLACALLQAGPIVIHDWSLDILTAEPQRALPESIMDATPAEIEELSREEKAAGGPWIELTPDLAADLIADMRDPGRRTIYERAGDALIENYAAARRSRDERNAAALSLQKRRRDLALWLSGHIAANRIRLYTRSRRPTAFLQANPSAWPVDWPRQDRILANCALESLDGTAGAGDYLFLDAARFHAALDKLKSKHSGRSAEPEPAEGEWWRGDLPDMIAEAAAILKEDKTTTRDQLLAALKANSAKRERLTRNFLRKRIWVTSREKAGLETHGRSGKRSSKPAV